MVEIHDVDQQAHAVQQQASMVVSKKSWAQTLLVLVRTSISHIAVCTVIALRSIRHLP